MLSQHGEALSEAEQSDERAPRPQSSRASLLHTMRHGVPDDKRIFCAVAFFATRFSQVVRHGLRWSQSSTENIILEPSQTLIRFLFR
jgi:hypothetical protein